MNAPVELTPGAVAVGLGVLVGGFLLWRASKAVPGAINAAADTAAGIWTGNNPVTQNATNAAGESTTAYQGQGVLGSLGAVTNAASGGWFASAGEWLGASAYDLFNPDPFAAQQPVNTGGATGSW